VVRDVADFKAQKAPPKSSHEFENRQTKSFYLNAQVAIGALLVHNFA
jgi:hypothetical protein